MSFTISPLGNSSSQRISSDAASTPNPASNQSALPSPRGDGDGILHTGAEIALGWLGASAGGNLGAQTGEVFGAVLGTALAPGAGTIVGGTLGSMVGGMIGAVGGGIAGARFGGAIADDAGRMMA